jgi:nicotinate-nucleotide--dimethylbenzimidazole phosphoribosyltransferase
MINYGKGGGGVNMFCRQHGFKLLVVDAGVDYDFPTEKYPHIIQRKVGYGTRNFLHEAAMSEEEFDRCLTIGTEMVDKCHDEGCNIICFGEMGICNTSPSSILMHLFLGIPLTECVGAGSGLNLEGVKHKYGVLKASIDNYYAAFPKNSTPAYTIRYFSGFEMACAVGGMLRAAELGMIILVDGFIMSACILAASKLNKNVMDYAIFGHCGDEGGHKLMLNAMNAKPLLHLDMRLGEGTGALCAYPIVQSAVNMINEMDNFAHAEITKYF